VRFLRPLVFLMGFFGGMGRMAVCVLVMVMVVPSRRLIVTPFVMGVSSVMMHCDCN
jgi:hypothetical protein